MTRRESEYTPDQTAWLLAHEEYVAGLGSHGLPLSETMDPANEHAFAAANGGLPAIDFAEKAMLDAQDAYRKEWPDASTNGHKWGVLRLPAPQQEADGADGVGPGDALDGPTL